MLLRAIIVFMLALSVPTAASAYTECQAKVSRIWAGNGGNLLITLSTNGSVVILPTDPNREAALSILLTAKVSSLYVTLRYASDGVACTATNVNDFVGVWLD